MSLLSCRTCAALLAGLLLLLGAQQARAQPPSEGGSPSEEPGAESTGEEGESPSDASREYQRHLDNGVRLYKDKDYRAAITEFEAAYRAEPKASPLINVALSHKALHDYPKAIDALDRAIRLHPDSMQPEHLDAAKREITELRQLLGFVTVRIHPPRATLYVDGQPLPAAALAKPIPLSPGPHKLEGRLDGFHSVEQQVTLTSGEHKRDVMLVLSPSGGRVQVVVRQQDNWVQVDSQPPTKGGWTGMLPAGVHHISVFKHGDTKRRTIQILVGPGKSHVVIEDEDGSLKSAAEVPAAPPDQPDEEEGERMGFYGLGHGVLLGIVQTHPEGFETEKPAGGAGLGARIGFRVADWAAFEGLGQLSALGASGTMEIGPYTYPEVQYELLSLRLGGGLRVLAPGRSWVRFVGVGAGGILVEQLSWDSCGRRLTSDETAAASGSDCPFAKSGGVSGFGQIELGVEFEFSNVLLDVMVQNTLQSTKGLEADWSVGSDNDPWGEKPIFLVGLSAHAGYSFW